MSFINQSITLKHYHLKVQFILVIFKVTHHLIMKLHTVP